MEEEGVIGQWEGIICSHASVSYFTQQWLFDEEKKARKKGVVNKREKVE